MRDESRVMSQPVASFKPRVTSLSHWEPLSRESNSLWIARCKTIYLLVSSPQGYELWVCKPMVSGSELTFRFRLRFLKNIPFFCVSYSMIECIFIFVPRIYSSVVIRKLRSSCLKVWCKKSCSENSGKFSRKTTVVWSNMN